MDVECKDCGDDYVHARGRCDTCYSRAMRTGEIVALYRHVSAEEVLLMRCLRDQGLSFGAIAAAVGRGVSTAHRHAAGGA